MVTEIQEERIRHLNEKEVREDGAGQDNVEPYLEELVVRRELSMNFCHFTPNYDSFSSLPGWANKTLNEHVGDERELLYNREQLENAGTHDEYWNAAMNEMRYTGYTHNYMRMYWGKKILEWNASPEEAFETALYLTYKYFLDGRDPNYYANVAWVFGQHDRGWKEREVYGRCATCPPGAWSAMQSPMSTSRR